MDDRIKPASRVKNMRTAAILAAIAATFFVGVFTARLFGADGGGILVLGIAVVVFLVVAIGRNLRSKE